MPKRSSKDINEAAFAMVQQSISNDETPQMPAKNPAAVALGKLGGLKGGPARAAKLSAKRRKAIALQAAKHRWQKP
jgi:hypothetical protein